MYSSNADLSNSIGNSVLAMKRGIMKTSQDPNGPGAVKSLVDTVQKVNQFKLLDFNYTGI
jgi:hypothetical protein